MMRRRRLAVLGTAVLLGIVALLWLVWPSRRVAPAESAVRVPPVTPPRATPPREPPRPMAPLPRPGSEPLVPIIDEVTVEKSEVCDGEESLVSVKAHTPGNKEDGFLHYMIGAEMGASAPLRVFAQDNREGEPPQQMVRVFGRNNVSAEIPVPPIRVLPCKPARRLHVTARLLPNSIDEFELIAKIVNVTAGEPMRPVEARWTFGDGTSGVSRGPTIVHDFSGRSQDSLYAQLLVTCEAVGAGGERVVGRTSLQLLNPSFEHLAYRGVVLLYALLTPRFPELGPDGMVRQRVRVWHRHPTPVTITKIVRYPHSTDGESTGHPVEVDPLQLFGSITIGPDGVEGRVELDPAAGVFSYELTIEGKSDDGRPAMGAFSVMRPPDRPTPENSMPVVDPLLKAKIVRARELLHQELVNDEDLIRLGEQGAFDDLVKEAAARPPSSEVPPMPPAPGR